MLIELMLLIRVLLSPSYWIRIYRYDSSYDKWLRLQLRNPIFTDMDKHTIKLNGKLIWIASYPYGSYRTYNGSELPSRRTTLLMKCAIQKYTFENNG